MYRSGDLDLGAITISMETESIGVDGVIQDGQDQGNPGEFDPQREVGRESSCRSGDFVGT